MHKASWYYFHIEGYLDPRWAYWFENLVVMPNTDGTTTLWGPMADQSALHRLLARLRDFRLRLIALHACPAPPSLQAIAASDSNTARCGS